MKKVKMLFVLMLIVCIGLPRLANAISWSPLLEEREENAAKGIKVKGDVVCLFQSGTPDVKMVIGMGDVLVVYRESKSRELKEVGKIKVLSYAGEDYLKGEVVEGEVKAGDIAKKGDVASLIISSEKRCK